MRNAKKVGCLRWRGGAGGMDPASPSTRPPGWPGLSPELKIDPLQNRLYCTLCMEKTYKNKKKKIHCQKLFFSAHEVGAFFSNFANLENAVSR